MKIAAEFKNQISNLDFQFYSGLYLAGIARKLDPEESYYKP